MREDRACLTCRRPDRDGLATYQPPPSAGPTSARLSPKLHPQRTSDLARGIQAPCSSTRSRAADLRPRVMPFRGIRLPAARPDAQYQPCSITFPLHHVAASLQPPTSDLHLAARLHVPRKTSERRRPRRPPIRSVSRRGRRRSQGAMTDQSWFEPFSPHQRSKRPQPGLRVLRKSWERGPPIQSVSRRGRRRSQGGHDRCIVVLALATHFPEHQQAQRLLGV